MTKILTVFLIITTILGVVFARHYVVGGGAGGSSLAYELYQHNESVTILERGADETGTEELQFNNYNTIFTKSTLDKRFRNVIQTNEASLGNRNILHYAAFAMAGGPQVSSVVTTWIDQAEFDFWAANYGMTGITYAELLQCYVKGESVINLGPLIGNPTITRGTSGPIQVVRQKEDDANIQYFIPIINSICGTTFSSNPSGNRLSISERTLRPDPNNFNNPRRANYYVDYLKQAALLPNSKLKIKLENHVNKLKLELGNDGLYKVKKIFVTGSNNKEDIIEVESEDNVILSAGVQKTAQILALSGIGNCDELAALGIDCVINNTNIGKEIRDHSLLIFQFQLPNLTNVDSSVLTAWFNSGYRSNIPSGLPDSKVAIRITSSGSGVPNGVVSFDNLHQTLPGSYKVKYATAHRDASISLNYRLPSLTDPNNPDGRHLVNLFKQTRQIFAQYRSQTGHLAIETSPGFSVVPESASDATILSYITRSLDTEFHMAGSTRLGAPSDPAAVVDHNTFKVIGTKNLYIVDGGIFPFPVHGQPQATISAMGMIAASRILGQNVCL